MNTTNHINNLDKKIDTAETIIIVGIPTILLLYFIKMLNDLKLVNRFADMAKVVGEAIQTPLDSIVEFLYRALTDKIEAKDASIIQQEQQLRIRKGILLKVLQEIYRQFNPYLLVNQKWLESWGFNYTSMLKIYKVSNKAMIIAIMLRMSRKLNVTGEDLIKCFLLHASPYNKAKDIIALFDEYGYTLENFDYSMLNSSLASGGW